MTASTSPRFLDRGRELDLEPGESPWDAGTGPALVLYVLEGELEYRCTAHGADDLIELCGQGSLLGLVDTFGGGREHFFVARALRPTRVYLWDRHGFENAMGIYQELARDVIQVLSGRLRRVNGLGRRGAEVPRGRA